MGKTILVVDDEVKILNSIGMFLEDCGFDILKATNGRDAILALEKNMIDLIILDINMPEMNGFDTCRYVRRELDPITTPVMMLTAIGGRDDVLRAVSCGAQDYCLKPVDLDVLLQKIKHLTGVTTIQKKVDYLDNAIVSTNKIKEMAESFSMTPCQKIVEKFIKYYSNKNFGHKELLKVISMDPFFSLDFLKAVYTQKEFDHHKIHSLDDALHLKGASIAKNIALLHKNSPNTKKINAGLKPQLFWQHTLMTAHLAKHFIESIDSSFSQITHCAGLLLSVGQVALAQTYPKIYQEIIENATNKNIPLTELESEHFNTTSHLVTQQLLSCWGFPFALQKVVLPPHLLVDLFPSHTHSDLLISTCLYCAHVISKVLPYCDCADNLIERLLPAHLKRIHLTQEKLEKCIDSSYSELTEIFEHLSIPFEHSTPEPLRKGDEENHVIVYDSEPLIANIYITLLKLNNYQVRCANNVRSLSQILSEDSDSPLLFDTRGTDDNIKYLGSLDIYPFLRQRPLVVLSKEHLLPSDTGIKHGAWITKPCSLKKVIYNLFPPRVSNILKK